MWKMWRQKAVQVQFQKKGSQGHPSQEQDPECHEVLPGMLNHGELH